jgi:hypothetical protein
MAPARTPQQYLDEKKDILDRCLRLTEDCSSSLEDPEALHVLLEQRMDIIKELETLETAADDALRQACPPGALDRLDETLRLILALDQRNGDQLRDNRAQLVGAMKANTQEQRFLHYNEPQRPVGGKFLDKKK